MYIGFRDLGNPRVAIRIMEKKTETTIVYWGSIRVLLREVPYSYMNGPFGTLGTLGFGIAVSVLFTQASGSASQQIGLFP